MRSRRYRNRRIGDFLKELHLIEGRNTGIPTALKAIKENGSPLPILITDADRSFFSVVLGIHPDFKRRILPDTTIKKRRNKSELFDAIISILKDRDMSLNEIYSELGYSGSPSKAVRNLITELIVNNIISYKDVEKVHSSKSVLILLDK